MIARRGLMALPLLAAVPALAQAQGTERYPSRPIRFVVPFAAGAATDLRARIFAERMAADWGQPVVVENRGGANGFLAAEAVARMALMASCAFCPAPFRPAHALCDAAGRVGLDAGLRPGGVVPPALPVHRL